MSKVVPSDVSKTRLLSDTERRRCTRQLRLTWAGMLIALVVLAGVLLNVLGRGGGAAPSTPPWLGWLPMVLLLFGLPVSYFIRNQYYKRSWHGHQVDPAGYVAGNLFVFALLEIVIIAGLVIGAIVPTASLARAAAVLAFVLMLMNFPSGRPLDPQPPGLGARGKEGADGGR